MGPAAWSYFAVMLFVFNRPVLSVVVWIGAVLELFLSTISYLDHSGALYRITGLFPEDVLTVLGGAMWFVGCLYGAMLLALVFTKRGGYCYARTGSPLE